MIEKALLAFVGAAIALVLREFVEIYKQKKRRKKIAALCVDHLIQIQQDLENHVIIKNGSAQFGETQYCEIVVGDFLYDLFTSNIEAFSDIKSIKNTTKFFHHYKVNMSTVKTRMLASGERSANLTEATFNNLKGYLQEAIKELSAIASCRLGSNKSP